MKSPQIADQDSDGKKPRRQAGRPPGGLRWTLEKAATEFDVDRKTLTKRIRASDIYPGEDLRYSTKQICNAVYGDLERERIRHEAAEADLTEMQRDELRGSLIPIEIMAAIVEERMALMRAEILGSTAMDEATKRRCLDALREIGVDEYRSRSRRARRKKRS